ncbi:MAG: citrate lyase holo-[Bacteroidales bacterium]|nr:citrate lyase holo-[acyl-carrier protein] synthase [Bacteroidales bacterium]
MTVSLQQILAARDERCRRQKELLAAHPGLTLVCGTVVMPGETKRNELSLAIARQESEALATTFFDSTLQEFDLETGYEIYLLTEDEPLSVKKTVCLIEENHPLGRLFDIDVIGPGGRPVDRSAVGCEPRKCLICGAPAKECSRSHAHSTEELLKAIETIVNS